MIGRRGFLQSIGAAVLGLSLALRVPEIASTVGTSIRFVKFWDPIEAKMLSRFDVFIGMPAQIPNFVEHARVWTLDEWNEMGARFPEKASVAVWRV